jgi:hypothetical protein
VEIQKTTLTEIHTSVFNIYTFTAWSWRRVARIMFENLKSLKETAF